MDHDGGIGWDDDAPDADFPDADGSADGDGLHGGLDGGADAHEVSDEPADEQADSPAFEDTGDHSGGLGLSYSDLADDYGHDPATDDGDSGGPPDHDTFDADHDDPFAEATTDDAAEPVSGTEPDLDLVGDDPHWAAEDPFPPQLDVGETPEPVDGFPWSDPAMLGEAHDTGAEESDGDSPPAGDLLDYDAHEVAPGTDPWQSLAGSDDPATSNLARFWAPGS